MQSHLNVRNGATALLLIMAIFATSIHRIGAKPNVVLWDTVTPLADALPTADPSPWKQVPRDLLTLESDPPKASSDPGYYGREYLFKGDAIVENDKLTAVFFAARGRLEIYLKGDAKLASGAHFGRKLMELVPLRTNSAGGTISRVQILRNAGDEVALKVFFSNKGSAEESSVFAFGNNEIVEVKPAPGLKGMSLLTAMEHGIVPSFIGDDLIYNPADWPSRNSLCVPAEQIFLGLMEGENSELVMTWPKGKQQMTLRLGNEKGGKRPIDSIDFENDGQSFYLAALSASGLWHKETLAPDYLEKDVAIEWKKPFPAKWKTQLYEDGVKTTFAFREAKGQIWRGVPGSYEYPVWFEGESPSFHLGKKVPPKGEALIYFLEGQDTPPDINTPVDILKATLGRPMSETILDIEGRKLRTHHRRGGDGVRRACTCGCTEAIQTFFENGEEGARKEEIKEELDDMIYFVHRHVDRIEEYRKFADELQKLLKARASALPELKPYVQGLAQIAARIEEEYKVQQENMKSFSYADDLTQQTLKLCNRKDPTNLKAYMELLKSWRGMGGAQDYVLAQCHMITRSLCQEAGYRCIEQPEAASFAEQIRARCRQCLRNPDGYEIWAEY